MTMAKTAGGYKGRSASIEAAMKAHGLGTTVIAKTLGTGRAFVGFRFINPDQRDAATTMHPLSQVSVVASTSMPSAPSIYWVTHHLTSNELIRIVALVVAISPDRKVICRLALPVRPGAKPVRSGAQSSMGGVKTTPIMRRLGWKREECRRQRYCCECQKSPHRAVAP